MNKETRRDKGSQKAQRIGYPCVSKRLFTLKEASTYLGRPVSGVRTLIWRGRIPYLQGGRIPYLQEGKKMYLDIKDLEAFIEKNKAMMF